MIFDEILNEVAERTGHSLKDESVVRKVNDLQKQLFRRYVNDSDIKYWDIEAGQAMYPLDFPWQNIQDVVIYNECFRGPMDGNINGHRRTLKKGRVGEFTDSPYYYILRDTLGIWPTPTYDYNEGLQAIRKFIPADLTINTLEAVPDLDEEYHMMLVFGVVADLVTGQQRQEYMIRYSDLLDQFVQSRTGQVSKIVVNTMGW